MIRLDEDRLTYLEGFSIPVDTRSVQDWIRAHQPGWNFTELSALGVDFEKVFLNGPSVILQRARFLGQQEGVRCWIKTGRRCRVTVMPPTEPGVGFICRPSLEKD